MASQAPPNYYAILEISDKATPQQIRDAYKRAALKSHPDRVPDGSPEREARTRKFQLINDAYYTLSDPTRRREYDMQRRRFPSSSWGGGDPFTSTDENATDNDSAGAGTGAGAGTAQNAYSWAWNFFTGQNNNQGRQQAEDQQFGDVFEEMLREEGMADQNGAPTRSFWSIIGGVSGGALGFILANVPGMVAGAVAGNRLGAVRDAKGMSVYAVFLELPQDDRARLLSQLAAKVFSHATGL